MHGAKSIKLCYDTEWEVNHLSVINLAHLI